MFGSKVKAFLNLFNYLYLFHKVKSPFLIYYKTTFVILILKMIIITFLGKE